ncbi:hypothetical protein BN2497_8427 [Janthinobacterium sp. CG23_2]|nr:hypothetical protein BN2497_8427 [Janthinobacterium sp. CG23_2]CUU30611.1 hypothetical protein BN3177_8427 [Janthinobacterium sp. CG23_2]
MRLRLICRFVRQSERPRIATQPKTTPAIGASIDGGDQPRLAQNLQVVIKTVHVSAEVFRNVASGGFAS